MFDFILYVSIILIAVINHYFGTRIEKARDLRSLLIDMCYEWSIKNKQNAFEWCYDRLPSYGRMIYSFRPLTIEEWVPLDQLEVLLEIKQTKTE